jgi:hypothetical protein
MNTAECDSCGKSVPESELKAAMTSAGVEGSFCHECRHGKGCDCPPSSDPLSIVECDVCDNKETLGGEISERTLEDGGWYLGEISVLCPQHNDEFLSGETLSLRDAATTI